MDQDAFRRTGHGATQCEVILRRLQATPGQWVAMPELAALSGSLAIGPRMGDLRKRGYPVENRISRRPGCRLILSEYRLLPAAESAGAGYAPATDNHNPEKGQT